MLMVTLGIDPSVLLPKIALLDTDRRVFNIAFTQTAVSETCVGVCAIKNFLVKVASQNPTANLIKFTPVLFTGFPQIAQALAGISVPTLIFTWNW